MEAIGLKRTASHTDKQSTSDSGDTRPSKTKRSDTQAASQRHIKTEQARRDKISAGFQALQDLLPGREKVEKAMLLNQAAEYITQLQSVLQLLMTSGDINKLPDDLQWQIRTLLPRKDNKPVAAPAPPPAAPPAANNSALLLGRGLSLPFLPLLAPGAQSGDLAKDLPQDEGVLMSQVQALLQQQQQQAAAAQQIQNWQQTLQALQLQHVLQQQQGQVVPDLVPGLSAFGNVSHPLSSLDSLATPNLSLTVPSAEEAPARPTAPAPRRPISCYADELPKCGLQQLVDAACEPSNAGCRPAASSPHKARKNNVKVRRHTTAARIPKPDTPNQARAGPGRPGPV